MSLMNLVRFIVTFFFFGILAVMFLSEIFLSVHVQSFLLWVCFFLQILLALGLEHFQLFQNFVPGGWVEWVYRLGGLGFMVRLWVWIFLGFVGLGLVILLLIVQLGLWFG